MTSAGNAGISPRTQSSGRSNSRRILFCANTAWSMLQFRKGVLRTLMRDGFEVHVAAPAGNRNSLEDLRKLGCIVHPIPMVAQGTNPVQDLLLLARLYRLYRVVRPALIFHYTIKPNIYGSIAARMARTRSIAITTGLGYVFIHKGFVATVSRWLYRVALRFAEEVWFLNSDDRAAFETHALVAPEKCHVLQGEGIDPAVYRPIDREPVGDKADRFRFLLVGRLLWDKGVGEFVAASRALRARYANTSCLLLGEMAAANPSAITADQIEQWVKEGVVEYLGAVTDVRPMIAQADCVVLPSYREGVPRVLLEASSMSRPVIATDVPGCRDVVEDGVTGLLCQPHDAVALQQAMEQMLTSDEVVRQAMGLAGRARVIERFDEKHVIVCYQRAIAMYA